MSSSHDQDDKKDERRQPPDERAELFELLKEVEAGTDGSAERLKRRVMMLFHWHIGSVLGTLRGVDEAAAGDLAKALHKAVDESAPPSAPEKGGKASVEALLANKSRKPILLREYDILTALTATDQERQARELLELVRRRESGIKEAALIAHLERLLADKVIARERKGQYRSAPLSKPYLVALTELMDRLGYLPSR